MTVGTLDFLPCFQTLHFINRVFKKIHSDAAVTVLLLHYVRFWIML